MRYAAIAVVLALFATSGSAATPKPCDELKTEIAAKLDAKGVQHYTLEIIDAAAVAEEKIVGSCDGGSKRITYRRDTP